jgi:glycosyltransferase involved in cell wall biosynthesis
LSEGLSERVIAICQPKVLSLGEPVRIAFVADSIWYHSGGTETQLLQLIRCLDRTRFWPVFCCLYQTDWLRKNFDLCPMFEIGTNAPLKPASWLKVLRFSKYLMAQKIHIVQTFFRDANLACVAAARLARVPVIISSRRSKGHYYNEWEIMLLRFFDRFVTRVLTNSEDVRLYTHQTEGIPLKKVDLIYNGIDVERFCPVSYACKRSVKRTLGLPEGAIVGALVANMRGVKGIDVLIKGLPQVVKRFREFIVLVVGRDMGEGQYLKALVRSLGLRENVRFLGLRSDITEILKACDIGILSSRSESLSNSILEYMSCGLPVVATDVGGTREMVSSGRNGYVVPSEDSAALAAAITKILENPELLAKMGRESRVRAEMQFAVEKQIKCYERYYLTLIKDIKHLHKLKAI